MPAADECSAFTTNVGDLVDSGDERAEPPRVSGDSLGATSAGMVGNARPAASDRLYGLANLVEQAIAPGSWSADRASAVVPMPSKDNSLLVVRHSPDVHDEIVDLLTSLREMQKKPRKAER
jgi:hypothetical protein